MKTQLMVATVFVLVFGLTAMAQAPQVVGTETARIGADAVQAPCPGVEPKGDRIGPRDRTRGENPPRDGRGIGRGYARGLRNGLGVGPARGFGRGQGYGLRDGSGVGRGFGRGLRDGTGPNCRVN